MLSHVLVGSNDLERSKIFYDAVLGVLGAGEPVRHVTDQGKARYFYRAQGSMVGICEPIDGEPATHANGGTIAFHCGSPEQVQAFHDAGVAAGGTSIEDPPGPRAGSSGAVYLCYLRDPDGNKLCGIHRPA
ncbi:VOC family protein [Croceicoccus sp. Ery5]|uniref:VOC family protein n=1 Tax=Croceicoccus sp. Ery5 TaxID=1703340 RepID=UPI001E2EA38C|nr:VOC family protein [Croceicoccus sp. Ery5]